MHPGQLAAIAAIKAAIHRGDATFDLLRGDEPYKAHWRATPHPLIDARVFPNRTGARVRRGVINTGKHVRRWIRAGRDLGQVAPARPS
jgi:CelD/BcsL family acetyltransferase involved in cellulose biosynthesis